MTKTAIITGCSKGIGLETTKRLLALGYKVYGLARTAPEPNTDWQSDLFVFFPCDLLRTDHVTKIIADILSREESLDLLINNAGIGLFGPHEQLSSESITQMLRLNLEVPILLTHYCLRAIKASKGCILMVSSFSAKTSAPHGCAYAASKAGLSHFADSLYDEVRKYGVRVSLITPDMTRTSFYDQADFTCSDEIGAYITPEQVADAIEYAITAEPEICVREITLRPRLNRIERKPFVRGSKAEEQA